MRTAQELMHRGVVACRPSSSALAVVRTMAAHRIHSVVVTAAGAPPGVVTDADVVAAAPAGELEMSTAADLAKACAVVRPMDQLETVLARMDERRTTHAVVADRTMRVVGVVSALDIAEEIVRRHDGAVELQ